MKTKNLLYLALSVLVFSLISCSEDDKDTYIKHDELPETVQTFLSEYLPNNKFISARQDGYGVNLYAVYLEQDIEAVFSLEGDWHYLQSEKGLPETVKPLLSKNSQKELNEQYSNAKITALSNYGNGELFISLNNNKKFKDIDTHEGYVLAEILDGEGQQAVPEKIKEFISKYLITGTRATENKAYPDILKFSGFRGYIYRLLVADQAFVDFYQDGEWFYMKNIRTQKVIQNLFIKALPEDMINVLTGKQSEASSSLMAITRFNNNKYYGFDLGNKNFVLIDSENKIIDPPLVEAKEIIKRGFNPEKELQYEVRSNTSSPYFLRYAFIATGQGTISLVTDIEGNIRNIGAGPITSEADKTIPLPKAVLEMLPSWVNIMAYLEANYPEKEIIYISHSYSIKQNDIPEKVTLTMSIPNNLKMLVFKSATGEFIEEYNALGDFIEE